MRVGTGVERVTTALCFCLARPHVASGFGVHGLALRRGTAPAASLLATANRAEMSTATGHEAVAVAIIPAKAPLPLLDDGITVLSFNVLLPNGNDGWWMYKSYQPHVPEDHRVWSYRKSLIREYLLSKDADVVCVQEASAETFEEDFDFMKTAGYDYILHSKFRFRSATFFKTSRLELACEKHKDRVLVTGLRTLPQATAVETQASPSSPPPLTVVSAGTAAAAATEGTRESLESEATESSGDGAAGVESDVNGEARLVMVVNCHLTGGPVPERRMRQVLDGLDTARKEAAKLLAVAMAGSSKGSEKGGSSGGGGGGGGGKKGGKGTGTAVAPAPGTTVPVVVCGDFNSNGRTAVWELLTAGQVEASYRERGYPETAITSKDKRQGFGPFADIYEEAYSGEAQAGTTLDIGEEGDRMGPPPTFLVPLLHPHFLREDGQGISARLQVALSEVFNSLVSVYGNSASTENDEDCEAFAATTTAATTSPAAAASAEGEGTKSDAEPTPFLPREGVEAWLLKINRAVGRGSEFRAAEAIMGPGPGGGLTLEDFFSIYAKELRDGKFWGVAHDLHALGVELPGGVPWVGPYAARFDRVFYSKATLDAVGAMEPLCEEEMELVAGGDCLPNSWHPSDHLGVAGAFRFR